MPLHIQSTAGARSAGLCRDATAAVLLTLVLFSVRTIAARLASQRVDSELGFTVAMLVNAFVSGASVLAVLALGGEASRW
jgi:hypothetical protein